MNGFRRTKVHSLTLGEKLRNIRNNRRVSLSDISKNTRIQIEYLEYLEQGAYERLPADVYVKGFLKSFAEYLNVDERDLIRSFEKEKSIQQNIKGDNKKENPKKINLSNFSINPKVISIVFMSLLFLGLSFYLYKKLNDFVSIPDLVILNPESGSIINDDQVVVSGRTDAGNEVFINNQPILVDENGSFQENLILRNGINIITVRSINRFDKESVREISVDAQYESEDAFENGGDRTEEESPNQEESNEEESPNQADPEKVDSESPENLENPENKENSDVSGETNSTEEESVPVDNQQ
ncbi:MAG: helix-turn-helix domain-containing protein [Parcubacteria group bacterium]|jgi:transcriptional regulator with XRE-family HTH domain|nr:helix-turn-helix domain-containing protein [Candidatus Moranbacteria bacterium]